MEPKQSSADDDSGRGPPAGDGAVAHRIEQAKRAAERAGAIDEPLAILGMDELNAPLPVSKDVATGMEDCGVEIAGYQLIGEISRGGQATVYKAVHEATGRVVAVKVLSGGQAATSAGRMRFEREVKHLAELSHPNIVGIIDRGRTVGGAFYLAMEYVDGPALDEYFRSRGAVKIGEVVAIFLKIARALAEAHRHGIVHRDLKPANVRVDVHGEPRLLDFGLARMIGDEAAAMSAMPTITMPNQIVGSVPWASPEQIEGGEVDFRSDIYSLGLMIYRVVKGAFPFPAENLLEALRSIASVQPAPLESGNRALDELVAKCLQRKPALRYESVEALIGALAAVPPGLDVRWRRRARRAALYATIIVVGTASVYAGVSFWPRFRPASNPLQQPRAAARFTNALGMEMVHIHRGAFPMGSPEKEPGRKPTELQHPVELTRDFYIGKTEITERQYRAVMDGTPLPEAGGEEKAVAGVTWEEARDFCRRLSLREKRIYRLPTEAEWEYACRAGTITAFGSGHPEDIGWFGLPPGSSAPGVATKLPNAWGLYDMHGGVAEWCGTGTQEYHHTPIRDPQSSVTRLAMVRGGAYESPADECRSAARRFADTQKGDPLIGFRVVAEIP